MTTIKNAKKYFVIKVVEIIGEYEASSKVIVHIEDDNLENYCHNLLLNEWRGEAVCEEEGTYENGEISWHIDYTKAIDENIAEYLINNGILNLL